MFHQLILEEGLEFQDISKDSPENMLLLHDNVETKSDSGQLLFEYDEKNDSFICRILDKSIMEELIYLSPKKFTM
jgi:hypothetical protein